MKNNNKTILYNSFRFIFCLAFVWWATGTAQAQQMNAGQSLEYSSSTDAGTSTNLPFKPTKAGYYYIEAWGGNGASGTTTMSGSATGGSGGSGAKKTLMRYFSVGDVLNVQVGLQGNGRTAGTGKWFGSGGTGGLGGSKGGGDSYLNGGNGGGGGGASGILLNGTSSGYIILAAACGGGGGGNARQKSGLSGMDGSDTNRSAPSGSGNTTYSSNGAAGSNGTNGTGLVWGAGGAGGGGGGGYSLGGFGAPGGGRYSAPNPADSDVGGGAGGGMNYINGNLSYSSYVSHSARPAAAGGNGYVYITYLGNQVSKVSDLAIPSSICGSSYTLPMVPKPIESNDSYGIVAGSGVWQMSSTSTFASVSTPPTPITSTYNNYYIRYRYTSRITGAYIYSNTVQIKFIDCGCATSGTLLFMEDFGGDVVSAPVQQAYTNHPKVGRYLNGTTNLATTFPTGGGYALRKSVVDMNTGWINFTQDASTSHGYMMAINAAGDGKIFYEMKIDELCGSNLFFSAKIGNLVKSDIIHPNLKIELFNAANNALITTYDTGEIPYSSTTAVWRDYSFPFTVASGVTSIICKITDKQVCYDANGNIAGDCGGNDFVIDDIKITRCGNRPLPNDGNLISGLCGSSGITGSYLNDGSFGTNLVYRWEFSTTGNINNPAEWTPILGTQKSSTIAAGATLTDSHTAAETGFYRFVVSNAAGIDSYNCRAMSGVIKFSSANPQITVRCFEPEVATCESEYPLQASYIDTGGLLGQNLSYVWQRLIASVWTIVSGTENSVTNGIINTTYIAKESGTYRLAIMPDSHSGCVIPSQATQIVFLTKPILEVTNPPAVPYGSTVDITSSSVGSVSPGAVKSYYYDVEGKDNMSAAYAAAVDATGIYYIKATNGNGCFDIKPVLVTILPDPLSNEMALKANRHIQANFFGGPFIPDKEVPGTVTGKDCFKAGNPDIYGVHKYTFENTGAIPTITNVSIGSGSVLEMAIPVYECYSSAFPIVPPSYSQQIYVQSEINIPAQSVINQITFKRIHKTAVGILKRDPVKIYLGNTSKSVFASTNDWIQTSQMQLVYSGSFIETPQSITLPINPSEIILPVTPFTYTGDNIVVAVLSDDNTTTQVSNIGIQILWTNFYAHSMSDRALWKVSTSGGTLINPNSPGAGALANQRNNIEFGIANPIISTSGIVKNVRYYIEDPDDCVDTDYTRLYGSLTPGSLPGGSSISVGITFKEVLPVSNSTITLWIIYNNGEEDVKVKKEITIQNTDCVCTIPPCDPVETCPSLKDVSISRRSVSNGYELSLSIGGGDATNTVEWIVDGKIVPTSSDPKKYTFVTENKDCGLYVVKAVVMSGCNCDMKTAEINITVNQSNSATCREGLETAVKVYYDAAGSNRTFSKPASLPMRTTLWGGGGGSGRAACKGLWGWYYDYVAVAGGGGGGGRSYIYLGTSSTTETVTLTIGAGGAGVPAGSNGDWSKPTAGNGSASTVNFAGVTTTAGGGYGGKSAEAHYVFPDIKAKIDVVTTQALGGVGNTQNGASASKAEGSDGKALQNKSTQFARASSGGQAGQPGGGGTCCIGTSCPYTIYNTHDAIDSKPGYFPGGGASGAARINNGAYNVADEKRVAGSSGATGRVMFEFDYSKPLPPVIMYPTTNAFVIPVTLKIEDEFFNSTDFEYQWYRSDLGLSLPIFIPLSGQTGKTYQVTGNGIYKVVAKRKGVLPDHIDFTNASNIVVSPSGDNSYKSGTTLYIKDVRNEYSSREIIFY